ncbi:MAG: phosphate/phosphite/phosphonate ABC transporter substrate-binding protein [Deltaproteobacteria bacterium]|nr:phosphate/phosphite/phosphonate ABC transporter substrate-binding protein [Deltaproteobacteria bacterium]
MKRTIHIFYTLFLIISFATGAALAGSKDMLLCLPGFPGSSSQAQPYVDKMLRHLESKLGWPAKSMTGVYVSDGDNAANKLSSQKPGIALVGPSVYASQKSSLGMKVIAKVEANGRGEETYSVITRKDGGPSSLADLTGKTVEGAVVHDAKYVYNVLLDKQVPAGQLTLKSQKRPLSALRHVARGKADAAIVDQAVLEHMSELSIAKDLRVIYTSKPVPAPAVVVMGEGKAQADKLRQVLIGMCGKPDGKELCNTLTLTSIKSATDADYKKLLKSYNR